MAKPRYHKSLYGSHIHQFDYDAEYDTTEEFDEVAGYPFAGWAFALAPFVGTPNVATQRYESILEFGDLGGAGNRAFYYTSTSGAQVTHALITYTGTSAGAFVGIRYDDGSDNNYVEAGWQASGGAPQTFTAYGYTRLAAGAPATTSGWTNVLDPSLYITRVEVAGTPHTAWAFRHRCLSRVFGSVLYSGPNSATLNFTPSRMGITFREGASAQTYGRCYCYFYDV